MRKVPMVALLHSAGCAAKKEQTSAVPTEVTSAGVTAEVAFMAKDFKENDSGLECIGSNRQQMGDGGMIAQFRDARTGTLMAATDSGMGCMVIHRAPSIGHARKRQAPLPARARVALLKLRFPQTGRALALTIAVGRRRWNTVCARCARRMAMTKSNGMLRPNSFGAMTWCKTTRFCVV